MRILVVPLLLLMLVVMPELPGCRAFRTTTTSTTPFFAATRRFRPTTSRSCSSLLPSSSTHLRSSSSVAPQDGLVKTITEPGDGNEIRRGDIATVKYACYVADDHGQTGTANRRPFAKSGGQKYMVGDGTMMEGFDRAVRGMRAGESCVVRVTNPELAYGAAGVPPVVPPNAQVELQLTLLQAQPAAANIDFDSLADRAAAAVPTSAADIAARYAARQAAKSSEPEKDGLEALVEKVKNFYFFGLFGGETGERPPWFLRPSITFPLAFAVVGAAFYITLTYGAITERGAPVQDELDEIILSMATGSTVPISGGSSVIVATAALMAMFNY